MDCNSQASFFVILFTGNQFGLFSVNSSEFSDIQKLWYILINSKVQDYLFLIMKLSTKWKIRYFRDFSDYDKKWSNISISNIFDEGSRLLSCSATRSKLELKSLKHHRWQIWFIEICLKSIFSAVSYQKWIFEKF